MKEGVYQIEIIRSLLLQWPGTLSQSGIWPGTLGNCKMPDWIQRKRYHQDCQYQGTCDNDIPDYTRLADDEDSQAKIGKIPKIALHCFSPLSIPCDGCD